LYIAGGEVHQHFARAIRLIVKNVNTRYRYYLLITEIMCMKNTLNQEPKKLPCIQARPLWPVVEFNCHVATTWLTILANRIHHNIKCTSNSAYISHFIWFARDVSVIGEFLFSHLLPSNDQSVLILIFFPANETPR